MTRKELLEEVKRRYPIGTEFIPAHVNTDDTIIINDSMKFSFNGLYTIHIIDKITNKIITTKRSGWNAVIYIKDKWADIIHKPESELELLRKIWEND